MVVILTPVVIALAHTLKVAPSQLLMPLSFTSIFGGTCTLIGTSTNILVDGVARNQGLAPFGMFEITLPGAILGRVGTLYMLLIGRHLLPDRATLLTSICAVCMASISWPSTVKTKTCAAISIRCAWPSATLCCSKAHPRD